jgi:two-component system, sensor histidine kinase and response regulator
MPHNFDTLSPIATDPHEIEARRLQRARSTALIEIPALRAIGLIFVSLGVFLSQRYELGETSLGPWLDVTGVLLLYAAISWIILAFFYDRLLPHDLSLAFLVVDIFFWTYVIYATGGEKSWMFFILLMRVADQTPTTFRRCLGFAALTTACYALMYAYIEVIDHRTVDVGPFASKLTFIAVGGVYISLAARNAERRRRQMAAAIRMSRDLIRQLEERSEESREARARAEEASAAKSDFLANISHEMRTPLHAIMGMLQLALDNETSAERIRRLEMARRSAESLLGTIDDILDFSKIEARKIDLEPIYFSVRDLLTETMKPLGVTAAAKGLSLAYLVQPDVPDSLWGDPLRLRQVLINLVGNAIKFTDTGEIAVRVWQEQLDPTRIMLRFDVRDTGIGIEPSRQDAIFQPFEQADSSHSRRYGGTGLGLAIVSRLVEAMGGTIDVQSEPGKGSAFLFSVATEVDPIESPPLRRSWEPQLGGLSVLVVDRNSSSRTFIAEMLRSRGVFATASASFDEAPRGRYACIVTAEIVAREEPLIVITSPLEHPPDQYLRLTRPIAERELIDTVGVALGLAAQATTLPLPVPQPQGRSLRLLVAEDHPVNQEFAAEALRRLGHSVDVASNGVEALDLMMRKPFDLVLMDVQMPDIDGLEVTRRFRSQESGKHMPIVALTAHTRREDRERCLAAGMDAVLTKPIDRTQLAEVIASLTGIDPIMDAVGGNRQLLARVSDAFSKQTPQLIDGIRASIAVRDGATLFRDAHKLKGSVSSFRGPASELATQLEESARAGDFDRASAILPRLDHALRDLERRLQAAQS